MSAVHSRACPLCETPAGELCQPKPAGDHLARYLDACIAGKLANAYMAMVLGELVVIDECAVIASAGAPVPGEDPPVVPEAVAALLAAGCTLTYEPEVTGGWFAILRAGDGRMTENGCGPTQADSLAHLADRLGRAR